MLEIPMGAMKTGGNENGESMKGNTTGSENQIRALIRGQMQPNEVLLEAMRFTDPRHGDIEVDFLVLIPGYGIAVIEVKGGDVTFEQGQWRTEYGKVTRRINPIEQARRAKHALRRYLDRQPEWTTGLIRSEWFVVMPFTTITGDMSTEARRELLLGKDDLPALMPNIRKALDSTMNNDPVPDADSIELALSLLLRKRDEESTTAPHQRSVWKRPVTWVGATALAALVAGSTVLAINAGDQPEPPATTGVCDPNYSPCIPTTDDLRCSDIKLAVTVIGEDIHGLDRDGDGVGCEIYQ